MKNLTVFLLTLAYSIFGSNQLNAQEPLRLTEIMKGNDFVGYSPENVSWNVMADAILFDWNPYSEPGYSPYKVYPTSKDRNTLEVKINEEISFDRNQQKYATQYSILDQALIAFNKKEGKYKLVYMGNGRISEIQRVADPNSVYFVQSSNLFRYNADGSIKQISNFLSGDAKNSSTDSTFLMKQSTELFEYIRDKNERADWRNDQKNPIFNLPNAHYYGKKSIDNIQVSPNENFITFRLTQSPKGKETEIEYYISADGHSYHQSAREKVTNQDAEHWLGILDIKNDTVYYVDFASLSDIRKRPEYLSDSSPYDKDRNIIMHSIHFSPNSTIGVCDVRAYDNKDRWIVLVDLTTGKIEIVDHQHDEAWIGGPGISSWNMVEGTLGWTNDAGSIYFQSEKTGFSHLYLYSLKTKEISALTSGEWEVHEVLPSSDGKKFYITANKTHPGNRDFYHLNISDKKLIPILVKDGYHEVVVSPDETKLAVSYSYKNKPWELYYCLNKPNAELIQLTTSTKKEFNSYNWRAPEVIQIKASDGKMIYARLYRPVKEVANGAAVLFVHGAGYLQNAHNYWSTYHREYMFHNLLADEGFMVLDVDYRASEGYGRDYRTAIYRHMGGRDLQDYIDAKNYLVNTHGIDPMRTGIYGGSYGGFITLMAMLTEPEVFKAGAALRSVTDWAHYNHEYTSNILNYPETDPEAYRKSSPIYFADQLKGRLVMLHGMVDDNVQFQDVVRLSQRFIELGKTNWDMAIYPVEAHGFRETYSWVDEYRRILELFTKELLFIR